jgi:tetratricopeptide (TPR) repeat protein
VGPPDDPSATADTVADAAPAEGQSFSRGDSLGRYVVLERIGRGGMGVVYAAYDPELDRKVAIKLMSSKPGDGSEGSMRLLREAQAMARLSHPNVISVHDVGTIGDQVFVAMEFVEGCTIGEWCRKKSWREIVGKFVQAGRGLAAAHAAGLVHRDFKPDNVLAGTDGRVRVLDFGLARASGAELAPPKDIAEISGSSGRALATPLTRTGAFMGTPAYAAPEQMLSRPSDARSDQFSFCVALWEALYGARPFQAQTVAELAEKIIAGQITEPPKKADVPARIHRAIARGLAPAAGDRHASMDALLAELERDVEGARRRMAMAALLAAACAIVVGIGVVRRRDSGMCKGSEQRLAGLWDASRKQAVHEAFARTGRPFADDAFRGASQALDAYAHELARVSTEACEATRVRGEQSEELLDLRMQCVAQRSEAMRALVDLFAAADAALVERAAQAAGSLPSLSECNNTTALRAPVKADPRQREKLDAIRKTLAAAEAQKEAGRYADGRTLAAQAAADAKAIGYGPIEAEALLLRGDLEQRAGDVRAADQTLLAAVVAAEASRHDRAVAEGWTLLVWVAGYEEQQTGRAREMAKLASAAVERIGNESELSTTLLHYTASLETAEGKYEAALADFQRELTQRERDAHGTEDLRVAGCLQSIAQMDVELHHHEQARVAFERVLAIREKLQGKVHPEVGKVLNSLGETYRQQARFADALPYLQRSLAVEEQSLGPDHPYVATTLRNLGRMARDQGRDDEALAYFRRALAIQEKSLGPEHADVAWTLSNLAEVAAAQKKFAEALAYAKRAIEIKEKALGADHPDVAAMTYNMGDQLVGAGRIAEARPLFERALATWEKALGKDHPKVAFALTGIGICDLHAGAAAKAIPPLERALALRESSTGDPWDRADTRFNLAKALWQTGRDRARAKTLAEGARADYAASGDGAKKELADVAHWLEAHK